MVAKKKLIILAIISVPVILLLGIWLALALVEINSMKTAEPDGKGRRAVDIEAGRTVTCVTFEFVRGGDAYACTPSQQIREGFENAALEMLILPLIVWGSLINLSN